MATKGTLRHFILPAALFIFAVVVGVYGIVHLVRSFSFAGEHIEVPGEYVIVVEERGVRSLWHEYRTVFNGRRIDVSPSLPHGMTITVTSREGGPAVPLIMTGSGSMNINQVERTLLGNLTFEEPGQYVITVSGLEDPRLFWLGDGFGVGSMFRVMAVMAFSMALSGLAFILGVVVLVRKVILPRRRERTARMLKEMEEG